jgi:hypothetical protein
VTRLLLDQGLPRSAAAILRADGWDVVHVGDCGMATAADSLILDAARSDQRLWPRISVAMAGGAMVTVTRGAVRIKRLPVER